MADEKRRHIAVSPQTRRQLQESKNLYDRKRGPTNWGSFLAVTTGVGLAALGVYTFARASRRNATTWQVECPKCGTTFPLVSRDAPAVVQVVCPNLECEAELILDLRTDRGTTEQLNTGLGPGKPVLVYCHHCSSQSEVRFWGASPEILRCPVCGGLATYGIGKVQSD